MNYLIDIHHGFGDVLHMVPAIRTIQRNDDKANIVLIMSTQANIEFYSTQRLADEYILLKPKELLKYRIKRGVKSFDYGIVAPCIMKQKRSAFLLKMLGCRQIIKESESERRETKHRVDKNIEMVNKIGFKTLDSYPHLLIPNVEKEFARNEYSKFDQTKDYSKYNIALCLGGNYEVLKKGRKRIKIDIKRWPVSYYHKLIQLLKSAYPGIHLLLIGAKNDAEEFWKYRGADKIKTEDVYDYMGKTSMMQSGALLERCDFAVGNDTGMIHLAASLGKPTMTIFCATDPRKIGAYAKNATYIEEGMPCKYCYLSEETFLCKDRACLTQIKPEKVMKEIQTMMDELIIKG